MGGHKADRHHRQGHPLGVWPVEQTDDQQGPQAAREHTPGFQNQGKNPVRGAQGDGQCDRGDGDGGDLGGFVGTVSAGQLNRSVSGY